MSTAVEVTGFVLCVAAWLLSGMALANDYWKVSSFSGSVITSARQYENLWHSCAESSTGITNCRDFESMLSLSAYMQACRALMIISMILGLIGVIASIMGLKCTKISSSADDTKAKMATTSGAIYILSGLCVLTAVSWYASRVVQDFNNPFYFDLKYELGAGLYMGWGAAGLSMVGGAFLCCSFRRTMKGSANGGYYDKRSQGQVYRAAAASEASKAFV
ncbi:claudin 25-like [Scleropages formosus]|uniref:Claudin n=1 Tax=Scleropages formosus TaxID=113540 RepID=A0A0P7TCA7_SCLFO|nr:claudin 25-like [Scleropages formosus]